MMTRFGILKPISHPSVFCQALALRGGVFIWATLVFRNPHPRCTVTAENVLGLAAGMGLLSVKALVTQTVYSRNGWGFACRSLERFRLHVIFLSERTVGRSLPQP